jgi:hypothetical protein
MKNIIMFSLLAICSCKSKSAYHEDIELFSRHLKSAQLYVDGNEKIKLDESQVSLIKRLISCGDWVCDVNSYCQACDDIVILLPNEASLEIKSSAVIFQYNKRSFSASNCEVIEICNLLNRSLQATGDRPLQSTQEN